MADTGAIREIAEDLDFYAEYWDELCGAVALLRKINAARIPEKDFENAKHTIERYAKRDYKEHIKELRGRWDKLNPRQWYAEDDDEQLNVAAVSGLLANFMGSFPTSNIPNPRVFTRQLLEDVIDLAPRFPNWNWHAGSCGSRRSSCRRLARLLRLSRSNRKSGAIGRAPFIVLLMSQSPLSCSPMR